MPKIQADAPVIEWHSAKAATRLSGLSMDMLNYLCRNKIVAPSGGVRRGRGTARRYTYTDVILLRAIARLLSQGISVLRLRKALTALQKRGGNATDIAQKKYLVTDGYNVYLEDKVSLELLDSGQMAFAFVLELASLRQDVDVKISQSRKAARGK